MQPQLAAGDAQHRGQIDAADAGADNGEWAHHARPPRLTGRGLGTPRGFAALATVVCGNGGAGVLLVACGKYCPAIECIRPASSNHVVLPLASVAETHRNRLRQCPCKIHSPN